MIKAYHQQSTSRAPAEHISGVPRPDNSSMENPQITAMPNAEMGLKGRNANVTEDDLQNTDKHAAQRNAELSKYYGNKKLAKKTSDPLLKFFAEKGSYLSDAEWKRLGDKLTTLTQGDSDAIVPPENENDKLTPYELRTLHGLCDHLHKNDGEILKKLNILDGLNFQQNPNCANFLRTVLLGEKFYTSLSKMVAVDAAKCDIFSWDTAKRKDSGIQLETMERFISDGHIVTISSKDGSFNELEFGSATRRTKITPKVASYSNFFCLNPEKFICHECEAAVLCAFDGDKKAFAEQFRDYKEIIQNFGDNKGGYAFKLSKWIEFKVAFFILLARTRNVFSKFVHTKTELSPYITQKDGKITINADYKPRKIPEYPCSGFVSSVLVETLLQMDKLIVTKLREKLKTETDPEKIKQTNEFIKKGVSAFNIPFNDRDTLAAVSPQHLISHLRKMGAIGAPQTLPALDAFVTHSSARKGKNSRHK
ncbi:MAG: hypothetical protein LBT64_03455 [Puniceicoccales bacterium]|nr:hypothetical protein [Puniceicoccales bacterium]